MYSILIVKIQISTDSLYCDTHFLQVICYSGENPVSGWSQIPEPGRCAAFLRVGLGVGGHDSGRLLDDAFSQAWASPSLPPKGRLHGRERTVHRVHQAETRPRLALPASPPDSQTGCWERDLTRSKHKERLLWRGVWSPTRWRLAEAPWERMSTCGSETRGLGLCPMDSARGLPEAGRGSPRGAGALAQH